MLARALAEILLLPLPIFSRQTGVADASWDTQPPVSSASKGRSLGLHSKRLALGTILSPLLRACLPSTPTALLVIVETYWGPYAFVPW